MIASIVVHVQGGPIPLPPYIQTKRNCQPGNQYYHGKIFSFVALFTKFESNWMEYLVAVTFCGKKVDELKSLEMGVFNQ